MKIFLLLFLASAFLKGQKSAGPDQGAEVERDSAVEVIMRAHEDFDRGKDLLLGNFRKAFAEGILKASSVEIFLLDFEMVDQIPDDGSELSSHWLEDEKQVDWTKQYLQVAPYGGKYSRVLRRRNLKGKLLDDGRKATAHQLKQVDRHSSAFCHHPIYGIRVANKSGEVLFQTSLCYICGNYFVTYPDDFQTASWVDLNSEKLEAFLKKEMPVPLKEIERFKKKYGREK